MGTTLFLVRCMRSLDDPPPDICKPSNTIEIVATLAKGILLSQEALIILLTCEASLNKRAKVVSSRMAVPWRSVFGVDHHSSLDCALKQARGLERPPQPPAHPAIALIHPWLLPVGESGNKPSYEIFVRRIEDLRIPIRMRNHHPTTRFEYPRNLTCECGPISKTLEQIIGVHNVEGCGLEGQLCFQLVHKKLHARIVSTNASLGSLYGFCV